MRSVVSCAPSTSGRVAPASRRSLACRAQAPRPSLKQAIVTLGAAAIVVAPPAHATFYDEIALTIAALELPTTAQQQELRQLLGSSLKDMLGAAERLSRSTGTLLNLNAQESAELSPESSKQVVDVATKMSEDALVLAQEAGELASYEQVPEGERKMAQQIYEAAKIVSVIAKDLANQEQARLNSVGVAPPVKAEAPAPAAAEST